MPEIKIKQLIYLLTKYSTYFIPCFINFDTDIIFSIEVLGEQCFELSLSQATKSFFNANSEELKFLYCFITEDTRMFIFLFLI